MLSPIRRRRCSHHKAKLAKSNQPILASTIPAPPHHCRAVCSQPQAQPSPIQIAQTSTGIVKVQRRITSSLLRRFLKGRASFVAAAVHRTIPCSQAPLQIRRRCSLPRKSSVRRRQSNSQPAPLSAAARSLPSLFPCSHPSPLLWWGRNETRKWRPLSSNADMD